MATDLEMNTVPGYAPASWGTRYGDYVHRIDFATLRRIPWLPERGGPPRSLAFLRGAMGDAVVDH
jgi:hypothetical protein